MSDQSVGEKKMSMHQWRIRQSVIETAELCGMRKAKVIMAKKALKMKLDWTTISELTGLNLEIVERIAKGKKIDID